ncbi:MAG: hypothetical protein FWD53_00280 [Phycisphaerales bacterium]|nr:hypothetical protein [Phycisphaerales bacterium]
MIHHHPRKQCTTCEGIAEESPLQLSAISRGLFFLGREVTHAERRLAGSKMVLHAGTTTAMTRTTLVGTGADLAVRFKVRTWMAFG